MTVMLIAGLVTGLPLPAAAATTTTTISHATVTTDRGTVGKTFYSGPGVGSNSTSHWLTTGDIAEVVFDGHSFDLYGRSQTNNSTATVFVDDVSVGTANYAGSSANNKLLLSISGLSDGRHTLRIEPHGWINHQKIDVKTGFDTGPDDLTRSVERYSALNEADYAASSWTSFQADLAIARAVELSGADAAARADARDELEASARGLVAVAGLADLIGEFEGRVESDYSPEAWASLQAALAAARTLATDDQASIAEVVGAKNALQEAAGDLVPLDGGDFFPIQNNQFWTDTDGNPIYSQGGGVFKFGDTYYWYGVKYAGAVQYVASPTRMYDDKFAAITVYSSRDLVNWDFRNEIATTATQLWIPTSTDVNEDFFSRMRTLDEASWLGRLGVAYNENTGKYVLHVQFKNPYDDPSADPSAGVLMLQGDSPIADFEYGNLQPIIENVGRYGTGDQTVFTDFDGTDYLIFSNRFGRNNGFISKISDEDSLSIEPAAKVWPANGGREGNAMFRLGDTYYLAASNLHGWNTSVTHMTQSTQIQSGYSPQYVLAGTEQDYSHVTQTGFFITVRGTEQDTVVFAGDRWAGFAWNGLGFNQWMPISAEDSTPRFHSLSNWELNAVTGEWRVGQANNYILNPDFAADRVSVNDVTGWPKHVDADSVAQGFVSNVSPGADSSRWALRLSGAQAFSGGVSQTVDVPDGTYRLGLKVSTQAGFEHARIVVSSGPGEEYTLDLNTPTNGWQEASLGDLTLTGDQVTVRIEARTSTGGRTLTVDGLSLVAQPVDRTPLGVAIAAAETRTPEAHTRSTWVPFQNALEEARTILSAATSTQEELDDATDALTSAQEDLSSAVTAVAVTTSQSDYPVGGSLKASAFTVSATTATGETRALTPAEYTITGFDSSVAGTRTLAVSVADGLLATTSTALSATIDVRIVEPVGSWDTNTTYVAGDVVQHGGATWQASWWTRGQRPGDASGPWQEIATDESGTVIWKPSRIFTGGERVAHAGSTYVAKWWTRNQVPGDPNGPWAPLG